MSHLHIPDGLLPVWLWVLGLVLAMAGVLFSLFMSRGVGLKKKVPLLGMMSAMMLVGMNLEIVPIAYHVNLSVITGIILGPWLAVLAAFIVNIILALVGHGGITVVGLNTVVVGAEGVLGYVFFSIFRRFMKPGPASAVAVVITLFLSTCLMLLIVLVANVDFTAASLSELRDVMEKPTTETLTKLFNISGRFDFRLFAYAALGLGTIGWTIEAVVTAAAIKFIGKVKPDMISRTR